MSSAAVARSDVRRASSGTVRRGAPGAQACRSPGALPGGVDDLDDDPVEVTATVRQADRLAVPTSTPAPGDDRQNLAMADSHEPVIRPASVNDADAVFELATMMAVIFSVEAEAFGRTFAALVTASDAHLLVADVAGQVGGYLLGFEHPSFYANGPVAWVEEIAVRVDLRRRDLGSRLIAEFEHRVHSDGVRLIALATTRAGAFYEAIGYDHHAAYFRKIL